LIVTQHGQVPPSRVANSDLGKTIASRMDAFGRFESGYRGFWTGIRRQSLFLLVNGMLSDLKHGGRFGHMRNQTRL
jgi:hypothetical protein